MNYSQNDIENVLEYWQDISQDVQYISDELNLDINNVIDILSKLQSENQISGFEKIQKRKQVLQEKTVQSFLESLDPETLKALKLDKLKSKEYFFTEKEVNEIYDNHIFLTKVSKITCDGDFVVITLNIEYRNTEFDIFMVYFSDDTVFYGSEKGKSELSRFFETMGPDNIEEFNIVTSRILDDHIPEDFWEVRGFAN